MFLSALRLLIFVLPLPLESSVMKETHVIYLMWEQGHRPVLQFNINIKQTYPLVISDVHIQETKHIIDRLCID